VTGTRRQRSDGPAVASRRRRLDKHMEKQVMPCHWCWLAMRRCHHCQSVTWRVPLVLVPCMSPVLASSLFIDSFIVCAMYRTAKLTGTRGVLARMYRVHCVHRLKSSLFCLVWFGLVWSGLVWVVGNPRRPKPPTSQDVCTHTHTKTSSRCAWGPLGC
jgi:hypothetical protein